VWCKPCAVDVEIQPLDEDTWPLLTDLFGPNGAVAGCWCTWFMQTRKERAERGNDGNRELLHGLVRAGRPLGLLAIEDRKAAGWVAVAPRPTYSRLEASPVSRVDDNGPDVWTVTCFFVRAGARRHGIGGALLVAAVDYALSRGARVVEGFPVDTAGRRVGSGELYHGTLGMFSDAGFELIERRGTRRALVRRG
jgi:GNAT superfamily N-acetyltransferase